MSRMARIDTNKKGVVIKCLSSPFGYFTCHGIREHFVPFVAKKKGHEWPKKVSHEWHE